MHTRKQVRKGAVFLALLLGVGGALVIPTAAQANPIVLGARSCTSLQQVESRSYVVDAAWHTHVGSSTQLQSWPAPASGMYRFASFGFTYVSSVTIASDWDITDPAHYCTRAN